MNNLVQARSEGGLKTYQVVRIFMHHIYSWGQFTYVLETPPLYRGETQSKIPAFSDGNSYVWLHWVDRNF